MSANTFKRLNISDNFVVPYVANKIWDISSSLFADNKIVVNVGINTTNSLFDPISEYKTNGQYDRLVYNMVNTTYYPGFLPYTVSTQSLQNTIYNDGTLSTSSYNNGLINLGNNDTIKYFPTGNNATVYVINVPRSLTSDKILPTTFEVYFSQIDYEGFTTTYKIYDDGNYNLFFSGSPVTSNLGTTLTQGTYVGNVFYENNVAILTVIPNSVRLRGWRPIDPTCIQASPSPTPSVTPSITISPSKTPTPSLTPSVTRTPSKTPSKTPSVTVSPSITPTISTTPSVTPTVTPSITITPSVTPSLSPPFEPTFTAINYSDVVNIENVTTNGYRFYAIDYSLYPVNDINPILYGSMRRLTSPVQVRVSGYEGGVGLYNLKLYKNNSLQQSIPLVDGTTAYTFNLVTFNVGDTCKVELVEMAD